MPDNLHHHTNAAACNSSVSTLDIIAEGVGEMKLEEEDNDAGDHRGDSETVKSAVYPARRCEPDCLYYLRTGTCRYGQNCRFNHPSGPVKVARGNEELLPQRVGQSDCGFYLKTGTCKYGSTCKYNHPRDWCNVAPVALNSLGLPLRQEEKCCPYYMRTFSCKYGVACRFHHPQPFSIPALTQSAFTVPEPGDIGSLGSSILPSTGLAYVDGLPTLLLSKAQSVSDQCDVGAQTYMPYLFSPSQSMMPVQGWNSFMVNALAANISHLPQRPGQPDCRYFLINGSCRYGANCKYHHPTERTTQIAVNSLGPHGLPMRPGEPTCVNFSMYGICKYGPTCQFNHPISCYFSNFSLGIPYVPIVDQSSIPYSRNYLNIATSETSASKSRITDWIHKPDVGDEKKHQSDVKCLEDAQEKANNLSNSLQASPALPLNQSDH